MAHLHGMKVQSVVVEGGAALLNAFISSNLWDEARVFTAEQKFLERGLPAPILPGAAVRQQQLDGDMLRTYRNYNA